ncbi:hypothetical protein R1flu_009379 [Riccia fluitans]|uniref:Uncharacterized protein n=1 Tax=Riccia fluitans TaxID=41844 RepID=A0ABD1Z629_9MARC
MPMMSPRQMLSDRAAAISFGLCLLVVGSAVLCEAAEVVGSGTGSETTLGDADCLYETKKGCKELASSTEAAAGVKVIYWMMVASIGRTLHDCLSAFTPVLRIRILSPLMWVKCERCLLDQLDRGEGHGAALGANETRRMSLCCHCCKP